MTEGGFFVRQWLRRLLLPYLLLLLFAIVIITVTAALLRAVEATSPRVLLWVAAVTAVIGAVTTWFITRQFLRDQADYLRASFKFPAPAPTNAPPRALDELLTNASQSLERASDDKVQLLAIISSMSDGLIALDDQQRVLLTNRASEQLLGVTPNTVGKHLWEATHQRQLVSASARAMLTGGDDRFVMAAGEGRFLEVSIRRLRISHRTNGLIMLFHDLTDMVQYEELRKQFVANVSHELRTPLTVINGFVETLSDGVIDDPPKARECLTIIHRHTQQLVNLLNDLLDLSRLDNVDRTTENVPMALEPVLRKVVDMMESAANHRQQTLELRVDPDLPQIRGSANDLFRAIGNLVDNAIKYTGEGGKIVMSARRVDGDILVSVEDNGMGINEDDIPRVFERFYRVDKSRSRTMGGTGLGLSIVKHVVQSHGGTVAVTSKPGAGSCFSLRIPEVNPK